VEEMTAEIAVMNRRAVAFAADSAMTISRTGKTYNSADKIFEVSTNDPIGLMVYNALDYMEMPLDVIIKDFRISKYCRKFSHIFNFQSSFFDYLQREFSILGEDEDAHVAALTYVLFEEVQNAFFEEFVRTEGTRRRRGNRNRANPHDIFVNTVDRFLNRFRSFAISECYWDCELEDFLNRYDSAFVSALNCFGNLPLDDSDKTLLKQLAALSLQRSYFSPFHTGFVFAGFGEGQMFPALQSFQLPLLKNEWVGV
jgi:hypothetical protein